MMCSSFRDEMASDSSPMEGSTCLQFVQYLVDSQRFDYVVGLLIIVNAVAIGWETDYVARGESDKLATFFRASEITFCVCFTLELSLRLYVNRLSFFFDEGCHWNYLDFVLVTLQLLEECAGSLGTETDVGMMKFLRVLRLVRLLRIVRLFRLFRELHTIILSIAGSVRSLCSTGVLLLMILYTAGAYFTQVVTYHFAELPEGWQSDSLSEGERILMLHFGTLGASALTLFQAITNGISWQTVTLPLMTYCSPWAVVFFCVYIAFVIFALMNLVTGVFVESALETVKNEKDLMLLDQVRLLFHKTDTGGTGEVSWQQFSDRLEDPMMQAYFEAIDSDSEEAKQIFLLIDSENTGHINAEQFISGCFRLRGPAKAVDLASFMHDYNRTKMLWYSHACRMEQVLATNSYQSVMDPLLA